MNYADVVAPRWVVLGGAACAGLLCLMLVSGAVLAIVLMRRSRGRGPDDVA
jgi:putative effector of murein hydrolase LrgA (UPF0299 family)